MAYRSLKRDIDMIYQKIDKIAKLGRDNQQEYNRYIDDLIFKGQYALFTQTLLIKYGFDYTNYNSIDTIKTKSWPEILFQTKSKSQDQKFKLLKDNSIYQIGLNYYKEIPITYARVVDDNGYGAKLLAKVENGGVVSIEVLNGGQNYSTYSTIQIIGGLTPATASIPLPNGVKGGSILSVNIVATGSSHNRDVLLGSIEESDYYITPIDDRITDSDFQKLSKNKATYLVVNKQTSTQSATFSSWDYNNNYDKNILSLYSGAISYLLS